MAKEVQVAYPSKGQKLQYPGSSAFFVSFGKALPEINGVRGELRVNGKAVGTPQTLEFKKIPGADSEWTIGFKDVPFNVQFSLHILDSSSGKELASVNDLIMEQSIGPDGGPSITYPSNNTSVCTSFSSYGTGTASMSSGNISGSGGNVNGSVLLSGPPDWVVSFSSVPASSGYTLTVKDSNSATAQSTGITASASSCGGG